jgi:Fur family transcriptional regulator, peroxide stress response regulator
MKEVQIFIEALQKSGMRITPQRLAICDFLVSSDSHPTADDIYHSLKPGFPSLSAATVYNTLDVLVAMGMVNALGSAGDNKVHFDGHIEPHINIACLECHKIFDVDSDYVAQLDQEMIHRSGFKLLGSRMMYYGICPQCQNTKPRLTNSGTFFQEEMTNGNN